MKTRTLILLILILLTTAFIFLLIIGFNKKQNFNIPLNKISNKRTHEENKKIDTTYHNNYKSSYKSLFYKNWGWQKKYNFKIDIENKVFVPVGYIDITNPTNYPILKNEGVKGLLKGGFDNTKRFNQLIKKLIEKDIKNPKLFFPKGEYYGFFRIPSELSSPTIIGSGHEQTILKMHELRREHNGSGGFVSVLAQNTTLKNLAIDGEGTLAHNSGFIPKKGDGYACINIHGNKSTIRNVKIEDAYNKQVNIHGHDIVIDSCIFFADKNEVLVGKDVDAIHLYGETQPVYNVTISNCVFTEHRRASVFFEQKVIGVNINDNTFKNCHTAITQQGRSDNINIINNVFDGCEIAIRSRYGLGIMNINENTFNNAQSVLQIMGGLKVKTNDSSFEKNEDDGNKYQILARKICLNNNSINFGSKGSVGILIETDHSTFETNKSKYTDPIVWGISHYNYVKELIVEGNNITSEKLPLGLYGRQPYPSLFTISTINGLVAGKAASGYIEKLKVKNNKWETGSFIPFNYLYIKQTDIREMEVTNNKFNNLQGCYLIGNYLKFNNNTLKYNPYDGAAIVAEHADIKFNNFYGTAKNPIRSKIISFQNNANPQGENMHIVNNYHFLEDTSNGEMVTYGLPN